MQEPQYLVISREKKQNLQKRNTNPGPTLAFSSAVMNLPRVDTAAPLRRLICKKCTNLSDTPTNNKQGTHKMPELKQRCCKNPQKSLMTW